MDPNHGTLVEGSDEAIKEIEKGIGRELVPVPEKDVEQVRKMSLEERKSYARKLRKRKDKRKADRKARKRNRK